MSNLELTNRIDLRQQPAGTYLLQIILNHATVQHILIIE